MRRFSHDDYLDDHDLDYGDADDAEANRFCANGHAWFSGTVRGSRGTYGEPLEPDEEAAPDCPQCGETGYLDPQEAQEHCTHDPGFVQIETATYNGQEIRVCGHCEADLDPPITTITVTVTTDGKETP